MNNKIITQQDLLKLYPNVKYVCGIDETGFGSAAGTCTLGLVILPIDSDLKVKDSKKYSSHNARQKSAVEVRKTAIHGVVRPISATEINMKGLGPAKNRETIQLLRDYLHNYLPHNIVAVLDGNYIPTLPVDLQMHNIIATPKADENIKACSAASVIAKVHRDEYMMDLHKYPEYNMFNFKQNKGYLTAEHIAALKQHGPSLQHRMIKPVKEIIEWREKRLLRKM